MQRSVLLQLLGLSCDGTEAIDNSVLYDFPVDWCAVVNRLQDYPEEASAAKEIYQFSALASPLRVAVRMKKYPLTIEAATAFLRAYNDSLDSCVFCDACRNQHTSVDVIKLFLRNDSSLVFNPVKVSSQSNLLPLHMAAVQGNEEVIRELIRAYPLSLSHKGNGDLPLAYACLYNHQSLDVIELLLEEGIKYKVGGSNAAGGLLSGYPHSLLHCIISRYRICYSNMLPLAANFWARTKLCIQFAAVTCRTPKNKYTKPTKVPVTFAAIDIALELTRSSKLKLRRLGKEDTDYVEPMDANEFLGFVFAAIKRHENTSLLLRNEKGLLAAQYAVECGITNETGLQHIVDALQSLPQYLIRDFEDRKKKKWNFNRRWQYENSSCSMVPFFLSS